MTNTLIVFSCSVLALQELTEKADCVLPIENQVPQNSPCPNFDPFTLYIQLGCDLNTMY